MIQSLDFKIQSLFAASFDFTHVAENFVEIISLIIKVIFKVFPFFVQCNTIKLINKEHRLVFD